jgi:hypothetical protein
MNLWVAPFVAALQNYLGAPVKILRLSILDIGEGMKTRISNIEPNDD